MAFLFQVFYEPSPRVFKTESEAVVLGVLKLRGNKSALDEVGIHVDKVCIDGKKVYVDFAKGGLARFDPAWKEILRGQIEDVLNKKFPGLGISVDFRGE